MPDIFDLFSRYFWLLALVLTVFNTFSYRQSIKRLSKQQTIESMPRYAPWPYGFILLNVVIWLTMGIGMVVGQIPSIFDYFDPGAGNPYVLAWHAVVVSSWVIGCLWVFVGHGAQFIVDHPGILFIMPSTTNAVRLQFGLGLLGGVFGEMIMWTQHLGTTVR
ncbi:hypothetical protein SE17_12925 [Kouleothrix aurantiaca]|uniref:Uncharacterized protein n=1 Tax=Kouleothrix aurantiaca TaxID=186479 RepID=A0A0P9F8G2_9CHLR|nr:hypothetical protein SE17_12925 [Kouleothrix aurantiaca]